MRQGLNGAVAVPAHACYDGPMQPRIVYEDPWLLALEKPAGLHSVPVSGSPNPSLADWLLEHFPEQAAVQGRKAGEAGLFHRLDAGTSGLLLAARTTECLERLDQLGAAGLVEKHYQAWCSVSDSLPPGCRTRLLPEGFDQAGWEAWRSAFDEGGAPDCPCLLQSGFVPFGPGRALVRVARQGEQAWPLYQSRILGLGAGRGMRRVEVLITRGFRHQIRVHLASAGLPIVGDTTYGGQSGARVWLHAWRIRLSHPMSGHPLLLELSCEGPIA